jgi:hypothetical protein
VELDTKSTYNAGSTIGHGWEGDCPGVVAQASLISTISICRRDRVSVIGGREPTALDPRTLDPPNEKSQGGFDAKLAPEMRRMRGHTEDFGKCRLPSEF